VRRYPYNNIDWTNYKEVQQLCDRMGDDCIVIKHALRPNYNITHLSQPNRWDVPGVEIVCVPITKGNLQIIEQLRACNQARKERANGRKKKQHSDWAKAARAARMAKLRG